MDVTTMRAFCIQFNVPERGEERKWEPFSGRDEQL